MSRAIAVLRPEPGNRVTASAIEARGRRAIRLPLFAVRPVAWQAPDPARFDALLLTSANTIRWGGEALAKLRHLPVYAVGGVTAEAAARAGFAVAAAGNDGAPTLLALAEQAGVRHALHLGGAERTIAAEGIVAEAVTVYASDPLPIAPDMLEQLADCVALVHSARAGARLDAIAPERAGIAIVAISAAAARACGTGWRVMKVPEPATPEAMVDQAIALAD